MNRELKKFLKKFREPDGEISDFLDNSHYDYLPNKSGAYIFLSQKQKFIYPRKRSAVIYIGMSKNLHNRLETHRKIFVDFDSKTKAERLDSWYYSKYQYMKSFGGKIFWFTTRGKQSPKKLEMELLEFFYDEFLSLPVGNGAFSFHTK